ncbi:MAG: hypothetical protein QOG87_894 [Actinomycetota bacterium]|jgi:hypothetical protein
MVMLCTFAACGGGSSGDGGGEQFGTPPTDGAPAATTASTAPAAAGRLTPAAVEASATAPPGTDARGVVVSYAATNLVDGDPSTAWRVPGSGQGVVLTLKFAKPVIVTRIGIIPGYAKVDPADGSNRFFQNRRVHRVRYGAVGISREASFVDQPELQTVDVVSKPSTSVTVEILESTAPGDRDFTAVSEIEVSGLPA